MGVRGISIGHDLSAYLSGHSPDERESRRPLNDRRRFNSVAMFCGPIEAEADHAGEAPRSTPRQDQERRLRRERARVTAVTMSTAAILSPVKRGELSAYRRHLMVRPPMPALDLAASQHTAGLASDPAHRSYPWEGRLMARLTRRSALHEGPSIEPTAATQRWRRLPLFMPLSRRPRSWLGEWGEPRIFQR